MNKIFPQQTLTPEQQALKGPAKSKLYRQLYDGCIAKMKKEGFSFPRDKNNALGINVSELARWCGFKSRQTINDNSYIQARIKQDIIELGISNSTLNLSSNENQTIETDSSTINNHKINKLQEKISNQELIIQDLEAQLLACKAHRNNIEGTHLKQIENMLLGGGRTFAN
ncbi:hypothetical protein VHA01S_019_00710 [Vibrio halioticoli NBRC 102217]|uniref:Uncharacterized protein n=1 Tax=Vibrio halioticoli NBRC 102217 TaxID=1219072 RepID=V5F2P9_9VIBR|nr:hypothetical protein [Vibrio halioticoli]GAD89394.1 hypothetical protein VHA01S_019_00710 [Vibrio halioticoli NBRC 102217]